MRWLKIMSFRLEVSADVKKTGDPEKVKISITNIFPIFGALFI